MTLDELKEHFELLDGWEERYRYLIDLGRTLAPMDAALKNETTKVDGCMSQVWMSARLDGDVHIREQSAQLRQRRIGAAVHRL